MIKPELTKTKNDSIHEFELLVDVGFFQKPATDVTQKIGSEVFRRLKEDGLVVIRRASNTDASSTTRLLLTVSRMLGKLIPDVDGTLIQNLETFGSTSENLQGTSRFSEMELHTDGTFCEDTPDWIGLAMIEESYVVGGDTVCLHVNRWQELSFFLNVEQATTPLAWVIPGHAMGKVKAPVFGFFESKVLIRFARHCLEDGQLRKNPALRSYVNAISKSLGACDQVVKFHLRPGDIYFVDNRFVLHGRTVLNADSRLVRKVRRTRGVFCD